MLPRELICMLTPFARDWGLSTKQVEDAAELAATDGVESPSELELFLYAKGILAQECDDDPGKRKRKYKSLLTGVSVESVAGLNRLKTIVDIGETTPTRTGLESNQSFFDHFVNAHREWAVGLDVFVCHRDHPDLSGKPLALVERFQKSGLCYMHGPVVLQHYLVAMNNDSSTPMLNIAEFLKTRMDAKSLYLHIWKNEGGDSLEFLKSILATKMHPSKIIHESNFDDVDLTLLLKDHGPGLVSGFRVTDDFSSCKWQHLGIATGENFIGRHAMLLIGSRKVESRTHYLLQNWWKTKPYVEVDAEYLLSSGATVHFIKEKQLKIGDFPTSFAALVECDDGLDVGENFFPETQIA
ncbi:hypothetical protein BDR26DRAFT_868493 [Obelidium mucronatum]|nr:hypothetical protein BDR26DRAFT_868493 [Obelidium mucronatum]